MLLKIIFISNNDSPPHVEAIRRAGHEVSHVTLSDGWDINLMREKPAPDAILVDMFLDDRTGGLTLIRAALNVGYKGKTFLVCPEGLPDPELRNNYLRNVLRATGAIQLPISDEAILRLVTAPQT